MVLTADHGAIPSPKVSGGFQISTAPIGAGLEAAFDTDGDDVPIVELIQPTQIYVNTDELRQNGGTLEDMARVDHGPDGGEHTRPRRHRAGRRAERQGLRAILPVRPDDPSALSARGAGVRRPLRGAALVVVAMVAVTGCTARGGAAAAGSPSPGSSGDDARTFAEIACGLPHEWLLRTWRGWRADRGGEVQILPREYSLIDAGLPHVGPWDYAQQIPMLWYGPGVVPASPARDDPVTLADIAPTQAALLRFGGFAAPDGRALMDGPGPAAPPDCW